MANTISLSDLEAEVNSAREGFDGWAAARQDALTAIHEQHGDVIREVQDLNAEIDPLVCLKYNPKLLEANILDRAKALNSEESRYLQAAEELKNLLSKQNAELDALAADLAKLQAEEQKWPVKLAQLRGDTEALAERNEQDSADLEDASAVRNRKARALTEFRDKYERSLGLKFEHSAKDNLRLSFVNIDPLDPPRPFSFVLHVTERYQVVYCHPALLGVEELIARVNESNDFSAFVRAMRAKFVDQCRKQQSHAL